jgi:hypothetical protein
MRTRRGFGIDVATFDEARHMFEGVKDALAFWTSRPNQESTPIYTNHRDGVQEMNARNRQEIVTRSGKRWTLKKVDKGSWMLTQETRR